jgi:hypothetical protein
MKGNFYSYLALFISFLVLLISYMIKVYTGSLELSFLVRDFIIFCIMYILCRLIFRHIELIIKYYKKIF